MAGRESGFLPNTQTEEQCQEGSLASYLTSHGPDLIRCSALPKPLHDPSADEPLDFGEILRKPLPAQGHVITAGVKCLRNERSVNFACAPGTGKSLIAAVTAHKLAKGRPYRALVFCPPHLVKKWEREIKQTIPKAIVTHLEHYSDLKHLQLGRKKLGVRYFIVSNTMAKLGCAWEPAIEHDLLGEEHDIQGEDGVFRKLPASRLKNQGLGTVYCPKCKQAQTRLDPETNEEVPILLEEFSKNKRNCEATYLSDDGKQRLVCGNQLWSHKPGLDRWPIAHYIHSHLKRYFDVGIVDEVHEAKSDSSAIGDAFASIAASCKKVVTLTGTILGGYAWHLRALIYRTAPNSLLEEGLDWSEAGAFNERYGRFEKKVIQTLTGNDNRHSRGGRGRTVKNIRPGVMPQLFGRHLLPNTIFLTLDELAADLPAFRDVPPVAIQMDPELAKAYEDVEKAMKAAVKRVMQTRNKSVLGKMIHTLLTYPDHPHGWDEIGMTTKDEDGNERYEFICQPKELSARMQRAKDKALVDLVEDRKAAGRKCWVYSVMTDAKDVISVLERQFQERGLKVAVLRSNVKASKREEWIAKHAPDVDVIISHPALVETGVDLFDTSEARRFNFPTLIFHSTGYSTFTLRQAGCRAYRIGQWEECEVLYFYYAKTMQEKAIALMGRKILASQTIEGKFSSDGLAALGGEDDVMEAMLAKSLVDQLDDYNVGREWERIGEKKLPPVPKAPDLPRKPLPPVPKAPPVERIPVKEPSRTFQPNDWLKPKAGGRPIQIKEVSGKFAKFKVLGGQHNILRIEDIEARYVLAKSPATVPDSPGQKKMFS